MRRTIAICIAGILLCAALAACQPTPEETIIGQKDGSSLEEKINETADANLSATGVGSHYTYQKSYEQSKNTLTVDAILTGGAENAMPVLNVEDAPFESGDSLKKITEGLFPGYDFYDRTDLTREELQAEIDKYELRYFRYQNHLDWETGEPLPEGMPSNDPGAPLTTELGLMGNDAISQLTEEEIFEAYIAELYRRYEAAPTVEEMDPPDYQIAVPSDSTIPQENILARNNGMQYTITFANWNESPGSTLIIDRIDKALPDGITMPEVLTPAEELRQDEAIQGDLAQIEDCMGSIGVDYLTLYGAYQGDGVCRYIYTRQYNTAQEDYVPSYLGMTATDGEGVIMRDLWGPEYMQITTYEGEIYDIYWYNSSKIKEVENENVKLLPWKEVQEIFEQQIDFMLTPAMGHRKEEGQRIYFPQPTDITIDRIHLGLTKVLVKDTDEYRLIPTWNFFGTDNSPNDVVRYEKCYLTINAIDGSIIDRGVMY